MCVGVAFRGMNPTSKRHYHEWYNNWNRRSVNPLSSENFGPDEGPLDAPV